MPFQTYTDSVKMSTRQEQYIMKTVVLTSTKPLTTVFLIVNLFLWWSMKGLTTSQYGSESPLCLQMIGLQVSIPLSLWHHSMSYPEVFQVTTSTIILLWKFHCRVPRNVNLLSSIVTGQGEPRVSTLPQAPNIIHHSLKFQTLLITKALQHHTTPVQCANTKEWAL